MVKTILKFQTTSLLIRLSLDILVALNSDRYHFYAIKLLNLIYLIHYSKNPEAHSHPSETTKIEVFA